MRAAQEGKAQSTQFLLRAPVEMMEKVRELSKEKRRSINSQIVIMLEKELHKNKEG